MNKTKHTPEPWSINANGNEITGFSKTGKTWVIARTTAAKVGRDTADANARLIAAAPDLLAALEVMVERIKYYSSLPVEQRCSIEDWEYTLGSSDMYKARMAIHKAKGEPA
jgi:hypothetical protein